MGNTEKFLKRIEFQGEFAQLMSQVCADYRIGGYRSYAIIPFGYEDLNVILDTNRGKYFAKLFSAFRSLDDCRRYVGVIEKMLEADVSHPVLYQSSQGYLHQIKKDGSEIRLCLMQYIDGQTFYELRRKPNQEEGRFLIEQAARINKTDYRPPFVYDSWAIVNFLTEFDKKENTLESEDREAVAPLVKRFKELPIDTLPHSLVHGDIITTNVMKDDKGKLYIVDFAVSNWYPRIQELAVLLCDLFFDTTSPGEFMNKYNWAVEEYQKHIRLSPEELKELPLFARVAHAMHILGASNEKSKGNTQEENENWLELGRKGLELSKQLLRN